MSDIAFEMNHVYKKFKKGEIYNSLRDLIPALTNRFFKSNQKDSLKEREFWALNDISLQVKKGEAFGIIGNNGAGKSTILKLLCGLINPTKGHITVNGTLSALIEVGAGFHPDLTGRENIFLNGTILGMKKDAIKRKIDEIIDFSELGEFIDTPVKRYSSGMYARLGFSVAAHIDPDILVIDEVLSVGDYTFQKKCFDKMSSVLKSGATVIFVSHNLKAVADLCDRCLLLNNGEIVMIGHTSEVVRNYMDMAIGKRMDTSEKEVFISKVIIRDEKGECVKFKSGQKAWIDIEVRAKTKCEGLALVLDFKDNSNYQILNISTQRLGYGTFSINAGEILQFTFELYLHFASGSFHMGVLIYRSDMEKIYDSWFPTASIFMSCDNDIRGIVNLYPKVIKHEINIK